MFFKDTIPKANQIKMIISFTIVAIIVTLIIVYKNDLYKVKENITDGEKIHQEYNLVPVDNVYKYVSAAEAYDILISKNAENNVILFGFEECKWCNKFAQIINEVAKDNNIETVYYCNIYNDRKDNTEEYNELLSILNKYLALDANNNPRLYVPDVYIIKKGKIIGHNNATSQIEGTDIDEYYKINEIKLKEELNKLFLNIKNTNCNDKDKSC